MLGTDGGHVDAGVMEDTPRSHPTRRRPPALQVICLGASGGPSEDNVTSFLVRAIATDWARNSLLAVDAGSHLAPITHILERDFPRVSRGRGHDATTTTTTILTPAGHELADDDLDPPKPEPTILKSGPFAGLKCPDASARANAMHILRSYISAYLITHPHLDHVSGFAINTAAFHATTRPKTVAALPSTVEAMKRHIFNDVIWPNLTDEDGGVGFVTFQRLKEGGDAMVGEGEGRGYIDVCDGLGVRAFKVSHGVCTKCPPHSNQHRGSIVGLNDNLPSTQQQQQQQQQSQPLYDSRGQNSTLQDRSMSMPNSYSTPGTPSGSRTSFHIPPGTATGHHSPLVADNVCVVDSTAYFIRDFETAREMLFFGDVEPDSLSISPRNHIVWSEAARKIVAGHLGAIFIECSYDDSQSDAFLFGHLNPRHLVAELQHLAALTDDARIQRELDEQGAKKRKRSLPSGLILPEHDRKRSRSIRGGGGSGASGLAPHETRSPHSRTHSLNIHQQQQQQHRGSQGSRGSEVGIPAQQQQVQPSSMEGVPISPKSVTMLPHRDTSGSGETEYPDASLHIDLERLKQEEEDSLPLRGVQVIIIHIKDTLRDGPPVSERVLAQLNDYEARLRAQGQGLGCEFVVAESGQSYWI